MRCLFGFLFFLKSGPVQTPQGPPGTGRMAVGVYVEATPARTPRPSRRWVAVNCVGAFTPDAHPPGNERRDGHVSQIDVDGAATLASAMASFAGLS